MEGLRVEAAELVACGLFKPLDKLVGITAAAEDFTEGVPASLLCFEVFEVCLTILCAGEARDKGEESLRTLSLAFE